MSTWLWSDNDTCVDAFLRLNEHNEELLEEPNSILCQNITLLLESLPDSCANVDVDVYWHGSIVWPLFGVYELTVLVLLLLLFRRRRSKFLKPRPFMVNLGPVVFGAMVMWICAFGATTGPTAACWVFTILSYGLMPNFWIFYSVRCVRLLFLYRWNLAKADPERSLWYAKRKYILYNKFNMAVFVVAILLTSLLVYLSSPRGEGTPTISSAAVCRWIPKSPLSSSAAITLSHSSCDPLPGLAVDTNTTYMPILQTCLVCLFLPEYQSVLVVANVYMMCQMSLLLAATFVVRKLHDCLGLWVELMAFSAVSLPLGIALLVLSIPTVFEYVPLIAWLDLYLAGYMVVIFWSSLCSVLYPVLLSYWADRDENAVTLIDMPSDYNTLSGQVPPLQHGLVLGHILKFPSSFEYFLKFCASEFAAENILFLRAVFNLTNGDVEGEEEEALFIFNTYIKQGAPCEINISYRVRDEIRKTLLEGGIMDETLFLEAFTEVENLVDKDSWRRFLKSPLYVKAFNSAETAYQLDHVLQKTVTSEEHFMLPERTASGRKLSGRKMSRKAHTSSSFLIPKFSFALKLSRSPSAPRLATNRLEPLSDELELSGGDADVAIPDSFLDDRDTDVRGSVYDTRGSKRMSKKMLGRGSSGDAGSDQRPSSSLSSRFLPFASSGSSRATDTPSASSLDALEHSKHTSDPDSPAVLSHSDAAAASPGGCEDNTSSAASVEAAAELPTSAFVGSDGNRRSTTDDDDDDEGGEGGARGVVMSV